VIVCTCDTGWSSVCIVIVSVPDSLKISPFLNICSLSCSSFLFVSFLSVSVFPVFILRSRELQSLMIRFFSNCLVMLLVISETPSILLNSKNSLFVQRFSVFISLIFCVFV